MTVRATALQNSGPHTALSLFTPALQYTERCVSAGAGLEFFMSKVPLALFLMSEVSLFTESYIWGGAGLEQTPQMTNQAMEEELMMARSKITVHLPTPCSSYSSMFARHRQRHTRPYHFDPEINPSPEMRNDCGTPPYMGSLLTRNSASLGPYRRTMPRALWWS